MKIKILFYLIYLSENVHFCIIYLIFFFYKIGLEGKIRLEQNIYTQIKLKSWFDRLNAYKLGFSHIHSQT